MSIVVEVLNEPKEFHFYHSDTWERKTVMAYTVPEAKKLFKESGYDIKEYLFKDPTKEAKNTYVDSSTFNQFEAREFKNRKV